MHTAGLLHPTFEAWGGAEWFIHQSLTALAASGIGSTVYTHRWAPPPGETVPYKIVCHRRGGIQSAPWDWVRIAREMAPAWREHDVLMIHNWPATHWYHEGAGRSALPPALWYCHEPPGLLYAEREEGAGPPPAAGPDLSRLGESLRFYGARAPWRMASRLRARVAMGSRGGSEWLDDLRRRDRVAVGSLPAIVANSRFTAGRIRAIYEREAEVVYPVPPDLPDLAPGDEGRKHREILWVGRLTPEKRPHLMVGAWQQALQAEPALGGYSLVMVGDGPLWEALKERLVRLGLGDSVRMLRNLTRPALIERYRTALLTVHLGVAEPFGLVPLESMAAGTAVLAEGDGGAKEIIDEGTTGWAVEDIDEPTLADRLAAVPRQRERLVEMGQEAARHATESFHPEESLARLKARLEELAADHAPRRP